jgi:hypothetical protein
MLLQGKTILPYVSLVLLIVFATLLLVLVVYLLFRLVRRTPIFLRHLSWRCMTGFRRFLGWLRSNRSVSQPTVTARFNASNKPAVPLQFSFATKDNVAPWATGAVSRPPEPLVLVLGFEGSGKSSLLAIGGQADSNHKAPSFPACDLTWWRLEHGWALEINQALCNAHDSPKFANMLRILEQMCPPCPVDGLVVVLTAQQLLEDSQDPSAATVLATAAASIATQLGASLPVQLVISHANSLRGFDTLLELRTAAGQRQATLGMRLPSSTLATPNQSTAQLLREAVQGQILQALSMQAGSSNNFQSRSALELPAEIDGLQKTLQQFERQLGADSASTAKPWLQSVALTGFAHSARDANHGELVFAGQDLRHQLFVKSIALPPRTAYLRQCERKTTRAATVNFAGFAACIALLVWTSVTWTSMDQQIAKVDRLMNEIRPELYAARNPSVAFAANLGTDSLEKLLQTVNTLDRTQLSYTLVPSSWFSDLRSDALKGVGEIMSRTIIRARSEQLATDLPQVSDSLLTPSGAATSQRIEELPAYQDLIAFLDSRELVAMSMDSAQKLNNKINYAQFLRFMGSKPEHLKLPGVDRSNPMPLAVTQRFRVETLKSPAIDAALRRTIDIYWERLIHEALDRHPIVLLSDEAKEGLLSVSNGVFGIAEAQQLESNLKKLRREAELPSGRRIFGNKNDALVFFANAQLRLGLSSVVPSGQMVDLAALLEKRFESLRTTLLQKESEGVGPMFAADPREGSLQLSPELKRLSSAYASYMAQPFMRPASNTQITPAGSAQYLEWTLSEVDPARVLAESFREYSASGSQAFDPRIKNGVMRLARNNYLHQIDALFSNAAHLREQSPTQTQADTAARNYSGNFSLQQLSTRATNLAAAGKLYRQLQPANDTASPLSAINNQLIRESTKLLEQFEVALYREDPYAPLIAGIASWLRNSPNERMLASSFKGNAKEQLVSSREYVRLQYAAAALPLLEYLTAEASRVAPNDVVLRWTRLREAIEGYEKGNLSNGIYELERYVLSLAKLRRANECVSFLEERQLPVQRGDYFSKQLINLDETVASSCEQRITQGQRQSYENFAKWFNSTIAGRPPFSSNGWNSGHAPLSIPQFERMLSRYSELRQPMLADTKNDDSWPTDVGVFIARMDQLAAYFLASQSQNKPAVKNPNGSAKLAMRNDDVRSDMPFRARLEFRSGRRHEAGADQIIDWSISSGALRHTIRSTDLFQWKIGEPIEVQLRWAADSPVSPLALQSKIYNYTAGERIASFKYSGDWALFELLEKHKSAVLDADSGVGLFFPVPVLGPQGRQDAKAFITLHSPDGINAIVPYFPTVAPL